MLFLVTGGAGFIGSHLTEKLIADGSRVVCLDNFDEFYSPRIKRRNIRDFLSKDSYDLVEGDVRDRQLLEDLFSRYNFDCVVHLAAKAGVRPSIQDPHLYADVNINGTLSLLECIKNKKLKKFIFASSSSVYGNRNMMPFKEDDKVDTPISPYGATKKAGEVFCYNYHSLYGIPMVLLRFFTVYGPRQRPEMAIHKFTRMIDNGEEVPVFGSGTSKRDYTYIDDIIEGVLRCIDLDADYEIFNLGCSRTINIKYLIEVIAESIGKKARIKYLKPQPGDVEMTFADIHKAQKLLNYKPGTQLEVGIMNFISWYKEVKEDLC
ncbi:MAG: GDP-mannose 4,6-dehydratase [Candidatus Glassbacteria bacterium]